MYLYWNRARRWHREILLFHRNSLKMYMWRKFLYACIITTCVLQQENKQEFPIIVYMYINIQVLWIYEKLDIFKKFFLMFFKGSYLFPLQNQPFYVVLFNYSMTCFYIGHQIYSYIFLDPFTWLHDNWYNNCTFRFTSAWLEMLTTQSEA